MKKLNLDFCKRNIRKLLNDVPILLFGIAALIFYIICATFGVDNRGSLIFSIISIFSGCFFVVMMKLRDRKDKKAVEGV